MTNEATVTAKLNNGMLVLGKDRGNGLVDAAKFVNRMQADRAAWKVDTTQYTARVWHREGPVFYVALDPVVVPAQVKDVSAPSPQDMRRALQVLLDTFSFNGDTKTWSAGPLADIPEGAVAFANAVLAAPQVDRFKALEQAVCNLMTQPAELINATGAAVPAFRELRRAWMDASELFD